MGERAFYAVNKSLSYKCHRGVYMKTLIVEGNIGAGKSTLLHVLRQYLKVNVVYEPLDMWQQVVDGESLLDNFYKDTRRWAYTFQSYAFITHIEKQRKERARMPDSVQVVERSVFSFRYCFAQNCYTQGFMSALEWKLYQEWFSWFVQEYVPYPDGIIYLRAEPEICYARLRQRDRHEEDTVSPEYIHQLHSLYDSLLIDDQSVMVQNKVPILVIDGDKEFETDIVQKELLVDRIVKTFSLDAMGASSVRHEREKRY